jgi:hypothetical protein
VDHANDPEHQLLAPAHAIESVIPSFERRTEFAHFGELCFWGSNLDVWILTGSRLETVESTEKDGIERVDCHEKAKQRNDPHAGNPARQLSDERKHPLSLRIEEEYEDLLKVPIQTRSANSAKLRK